MPYRRLPNTDTARIATLEKAIGMEIGQTPDRQPASFKTLNQAKVITPRFVAAVDKDVVMYFDLGNGGVVYGCATTAREASVLAFDDATAPIGQCLFGREVGECEVIGLQMVERLVLGLDFVALYGHIEHLNEVRYV